MQPDYFWIIVSALGTCIVSIGGLIAWIVKLVLPKTLEAFERKNQALLSFVEKTSQAVEKISESISSFKEGITGIRNEIHECKEDIINEIKDERIKTLAEKVEKIKDPPASKSGGYRSISCSSPNSLIE